MKVSSLRLECTDPYLTAGELPPYPFSSIQRICVASCENYCRTACVFGPVLVPLPRENVLLLDLLPRSFYAYLCFFFATVPSVAF